MKKFLKKFRRSEEGATMVEYGIMVAVIAIVALAGAQTLGFNVLGVFNAAAAVVAPVAP